MRIAEAIERVRRQARQVGLGAVVGGVGEQLRSSAIPSPLRGAAWRIAALLDAACPNAVAPPNRRARELIQQDRAATGRSEARPAVDLRSHAATPDGSDAHTREAKRAVEPARQVERPLVAREPEGSLRLSSREAVPTAARSTTREVSQTASDSGEIPEAPAEGTSVRADLVGATPTFNATPVVVAPVDATPVDDAPGDALQEVLAVQVPTTTVAGVVGEPAESMAGVSTKQSVDARPPARERQIEARPPARERQVEQRDGVREREVAATHDVEASPRARERREAAPAIADSTGPESAIAAALAEVTSAPTDAAARIEAADSVNTSAAAAAASSQDAQPKPSKQRGKGQGARSPSSRPPRAASPAKAPPSASAADSSTREASAAAQPQKEKLAEGSEDAKNLARSHPRPAKRRSGAKADTSKKK